MVSLFLGQARKFHMGNLLKYFLNLCESKNCGIFTSVKIILTKVLPELVRSRSIRENFRKGHPRFSARSNVTPIIYSCLFNSDMLQRFSYLFNFKNFSNFSFSVVEYSVIKLFYGLYYFLKIILCFIF